MLYAPNDEYAMLSSVDFITPVVDDPYLYGQIAAANALSDIFAMGGEVKSALNLLMWDNTHFDSAVANAILKGGLNKITESNALLLGGHTIKDKEQKYGLAVNGIAHKNRLWRNHTGYIGDMLVLTKPLGSGILTTAIKAQMFSQTTEVTQSMAMLNLYAARIAQNYEIHACTDITGFGLIGHAFEMCGGKIKMKKAYFFIPNKSHFLTRQNHFLKWVSCPVALMKIKKLYNLKCRYNAHLKMIFFIMMHKLLVVSSLHFLLIKQNYLLMNYTKQVSYTQMLSVKSYLKQKHLLF